MTQHKPVTVFGPDFPFAYDRWITHSAGLGSVPKEIHGQKVGVIGAGVSGMVASFELMKLGLHPVLFEQGRMGGAIKIAGF